MFFSDHVGGGTTGPIVYQSKAENDHNTRRFLMSSYLSPLPQFYPFVPRNRSRSYHDLRAAALADPAASPDGLQWEASPHHPRRLLHPLYNEPRRFYHVANGRQPIVTTSGAFVPPNRRRLDEPLLPTWTIRHSSTLRNACVRPSTINRFYHANQNNFWDDRMSYLLEARHRAYQPVDARLAVDQAGAAVHAPSSGAYQSGAVGLHNEYSVPINQTPSNQRTTSYSSTSYSTNYNAAPPPPPSQPPPPIPQNQSVSSSSSYSYSYAPPPPPPQQQQQPRDFSFVSRLANDFRPPSSHSFQQSSYQQPTNGNGIQSYKTYTSTTTRQIGGNSELPSNSQLGQNLIGNPKEYIHDFATRTPIAVLSPASQMTPLTASASNFSYTTTTTQRTAAPAQKQPLSYAEELRNSTLTERQRQSNQFQSSAVPERQVPGGFHSLYEETTRSNSQSTTQQVDDLVRDMEMRMRTGRDVCAKCKAQIVGDTPGVTALGRPFHVNCFTCDVCQKQLAGCSFYNVDGKNLCQVDYMNSLEKCAKCSTPITSKILRALGSPYHPECFTCPACNKSLDGIPFTVSKENVAYCLDCYHERFSPRCAACLKAIAPSGNETEVARVVALDKSFHVACYRCEDCGLQLNSKIEGHACYPLESHLFCKNCNLKRLKAAT